MTGFPILLAMPILLAAGVQPQALAPPPPDERQARATVSIADYRHGDLLWENDRTAHRIYGRPLEAVEPPSGSGIDAWGKKVPWPFMERQLRAGHYHDDAGEGLDFYNVGQSRGAGGLGIWHDNKLWTSRNYREARIIRDGPEVAEFEVDYAPWPVDVGRNAWETRRFALPIGTHFTRIVSTIRSDRPEPLVVGIGIAKRGTSSNAGSFAADAARGRFSFWGPEELGKGRMAVAVLVDPAMLAGVTGDADNHLILLTVTPGEPFVYYMGAAWDRGSGFQSEQAWQAHVAEQRPDFSATSGAEPGSRFPAPGDGEEGP